MIQEKKLSLAIARFGAKSAFTALNRLAALKLMETRTRASSWKAWAKELSKGFPPVLMISPEALRDKADGGYRFYLD